MIAKALRSLLVVGFILYGCAKPYNPPAVTTNANVLVVEGLINVGNDSTIIKLSRTVLVYNKTTNSPETKASVMVENAQGTQYPLTEIIKGTYAAPALKLDITKQYRLRIKTSNGKSYLSDLVNAKVTPPIDSVGFTVKPDGVQIYINAHDATNNTRYYKYNYSEAWRFHSWTRTDNISDGKQVLKRTPAQEVYSCYNSDSSAYTTLNSTTTLSSDVVYQFPMSFISSTSIKIQSRYSILVSQQAITKEAYDFWQNLKKNTEQLGSIFDAQPSQLTGNIHNIADPSEPVVGYISAATVQKKRIYIDKRSLPLDWQPRDYVGCLLDSLFYKFIPDRKYTVNQGIITLPPFYVAIGDVFVDPVNGRGYIATTPACADCTVLGTLKRPAFWVGP